MKPPNSETPDVTFTCSTYVPAQMYTRDFPPSFVNAAPIVLTGALRVPALSSKRLKKRSTFSKLCTHARSTP